MSDTTGISSELEAVLRERIADLESKLRLEQSLTAWYLVQLKCAWAAVSRLGIEADNARRRLHSFTVMKRPAKYGEDLN